MKNDFNFNDPNNYRPSVNGLSTQSGNLDIDQIREYAADMELSNDGSVPLPITRYDTYDWYLAQGPLRNLTTLLAGSSRAARAAI